MSARTVALDHYRRRRRLADALAAVAARLWRRISPDDIARSWATALVDLVPVTNAAQLAAARVADAYLDAVLDAQGIDPTAEARVVPAALAGVASDGRPLASLLYEPAIGTLKAIGAGATVERALAGGFASLDMMVRTQVADAGRAADQVAMVARRRAGGYTRMVVGRTCGRCVVLAGRWYAYNAGFDRHPRCRPGATACTFHPVRTPTTTSAPTRASGSTACPARSRTSSSPRRVPRRSGSARTSARWSMRDAARSG
ncbi:hypothetical protein Misp04_14180 [Micromonospora sp. NBRC 101691]|nr:hypothetical protein Misp04_14180 [Micromonospora sp. NBRC 101691]